MEAVAVETAGMGDAFEHGHEERHRRHPVADWLPISSWSYRQITATPGGLAVPVGRVELCGQRLDGGVARRQVVDARRADELVVDAEQARRGEVVQHDVPRQDRILGDADLLGEEASERALVGRTEAPHRHEVLLRIELQSVVDAPVEVDRELGHAQQRPVDAELDG